MLRMRSENETATETEAQVLQDAFRNATAPACEIKNLVNGSERLQNKESSDSEGCPELVNSDSESDTWGEESSSDGESDDSLADDSSNSSESAPARPSDESRNSRRPHCVWTPGAMLHGLFHSQKIMPVAVECKKHLAKLEPS